MASLIFDDTTESLVEEFSARLSAFGIKVEMHLMGNGDFIVTFDNKAKEKVVKTYYNARKFIRERCIDGETYDLMSFA